MLKQKKEAIVMKTEEVKPISYNTIKKNRTLTSFSEPKKEKHE